MSAAELRKAAETLRELAEKASTGDGPTLSREWFSDLTYMSRRYEVVAANEGSIIASNLDRWTSEFIATMHPGVGLALAEWLDAVAIAWVWDEHPDDVETPDGWPLTLEESVDTIPLKIARLVNGGAS